MTSERQSVLCPNCRRLINVTEPSCPYCGIANPGSRWKSIWSRGFSNSDDLIRLIVYVNVGMFVLSLLINPRLSSFTLNPLSLLSPDNRSLVLLGATGTFPIEQLNRWWSLVSANYLHGGILHILFNMMALRQIAPLIAHEYGTSRMFAIYTISGVFGYCVSYFAGIPITIGASAAVCGLLGAALYYGKSRGGAYGNMVYSQIGGWVIGIFLFGFIIPQVNNWGHGGGLIGGVLLGLILGYNENKAEGLSHRFLGGMCLITTALVLLWASVTAILYKFVL